jgi:hypothetical protein
MSDSLHQRDVGKEMRRAMAGAPKHTALFLANGRVYLLREEDKRPVLWHFSAVHNAHGHLSADERALLGLLGLPVDTTGERRALTPNVVVDLVKRIKDAQAFDQASTADAAHTQLENGEAKSYYTLSEAEKRAPVDAMCHATRKTLPGKKTDIPPCVEFRDDMGRVKVQGREQLRMFCTPNLEADLKSLVRKKFSQRLTEENLGRPVERATRDARNHGNPWPLLNRGPCIERGGVVRWGVYDGVLCLITADRYREWRPGDMKIVPTQLKIGSTCFEFRQLPALAALPKVERGERKMELFYSPAIALADWASRFLPSIPLMHIRPTQTGGYVLATSPWQNKPSPAAEKLTDMWAVFSSVDLTLCESEPCTVVLTVRPQNATPATNETTTREDPRSSNKGNAKAALLLMFWVLHDLSCKGGAGTECTCFESFCETTHVSTTDLLKVLATLHRWPSSVQEWLKHRVPELMPTDRNFNSFVSALWDRSLGPGRIFPLWEIIATQIDDAATVQDVAQGVLRVIALEEQTARGHGKYSGLEKVVEDLRAAPQRGSTGKRCDEYDCISAVTFITSEAKVRFAGFRTSFDDKWELDKDFRDHLLMMLSLDL